MKKHAFVFEKILLLKLTQKISVKTACWCSQFSNILHSYTKISTTKSTFLQENEWSHPFETYSLQNIHLRQMKSWKSFFNILKKVSLILTQKFFKKHVFIFFILKKADPPKAHLFSKNIISHKKKHSRTKQQKTSAPQQIFSSSILHLS